MCVELTGGLAAHIAGFQDILGVKLGEEEVQVDKAPSSVQKDKLAFVGQHTPNRRTSFHSRSHFLFSLLYEYRIHHHKHLQRVNVRRLQAKAVILRSNKHMLQSGKQLCSEDSGKLIKDSPSKYFPRL